MTDPSTNDFIATLAGTYIASLQQAIDLIATTHPDLSPKKVVMEAERRTPPARAALREQGTIARLRS